MLQEIYIKNFVLIDELRLELGPGLNVLTGETGAGKSIIIDALGLVMGDRINSDYLRNQEQRALIQAVFVLNDDDPARKYLFEAGLLEDDEDNLVVTREIIPPGRSTARINGKNVSASVLRELAALLLDLHLQHDHLNMLKPDMYLNFVDSFADGSNVLAGQTNLLFKQIKELRDQLEDLCDQEQERLQRVDFLAFQIKEIEQARLAPGEEEEMTALRDRIRNSGKLAEGADRVMRLLYEGESGKSAFDQIASALDVVQSLKEDSFFGSLIEPLDEAYYSIQDLASQIARFRDSLDFEPGLLDTVEERLHRIDRLKSRYGRDVNEILAFLENARREKDRLENSQEQMQSLQGQIDALEGEYMKTAGQLSELRRRAAINLESQVYTELKELGLPRIKFKVKVEQRLSPGPKGLDQVEFLFSANPGEEPRALARVASGGEISRVVLALKKALAASYQMPTLIFDEIDVGLGGTALTAMAGKIFELSCSHQVVLVTHSPQVAAYAQRHFCIEKEISQNHTAVRVEILDHESRAKELARMLGGEDFSSLTLEHARELLNSRQSACRHTPGTH